MIIYLYMILFLSITCHFEFQEEMNILSYHRGNLKESLWKEDIHSAYSMSQVCVGGGDTQLKAAAVIHGPLFDYNQWLRKWNNAVQQLKTKCEDKNWLISEEKICPF